MLLVAVAEIRVLGVPVLALVDTGEPFDRRAIVNTCTGIAARVSGAVDRTVVQVDLAEA